MPEQEIATQVAVETAPPTVTHEVALDHEAVATHDVALADVGGPVTGGEYVQYAAPSTQAPEEAVEETRRDKAIRMADAMGIDPEEAGQMFDETSAREDLARVTDLPDADKKAALAAMTPEQLDNMMKSLPPEEKGQLTELATHVDDGQRKLDLFLAGQKAKLAVATDLDRAIEDMDPMDPIAAAKMLDRRRKIAESTLKELDGEVQLLGKAPDPAAVQAMIARKSAEHDLEMEYGVNLTATGEVRKGGPLDGLRVEWTVDELAVMKAAFDQAPSSVGTDNPRLMQIKRVMELPADAKGNRPNAEYDPSKLEIRMADQSVSDGMGNYDLLGEPLDDKLKGLSREASADPNVVTDLGPNPKFMEWVALHEIGHSTQSRDGAFAEYEKNMGIEHGLDRAALDKRLGTSDATRLTSLPAGSGISVGGTTYISQGDGTVKAMPTPLHDEVGANPDPGEYFAEHHNQAVLAPEATAVEYLDAPRERERLATARVTSLEYQREAMVAINAPTATIDAELARMKEEQRNAKGQAELWEKEYDVVRNDVFHADDAEVEAKHRLAAEGFDTKRFEERARRLSTPEQIARLETEMRVEAQLRDEQLDSDDAAYRALRTMGVSPSEAEKMVAEGRARRGER